MMCKSSTNELNIYIHDLQNNKSRYFTPGMFQEGNCIITLLSSQLFVYSKWYTYVLEISNILNLKTTIKTEIPENFKYLYSGGVYYKNSIYLFGGIINNMNCDGVRRFDLEKKLWYHIAPLPKASSKCACTLFYDSILICGVSHQEIYKYDLNTASYSIINAMVMKSFTPRVLFKANSRVYFFERVSGIFESDLENEYKFKRIGRSKLEWESVSQVKYYNHCVYFISSVNRKIQIFKFDLSAKKLIKLI